MRSYHSVNSRTVNVLVKKSNTLADVFEKTYLGNTAPSSGGGDLSSYALKTDVDSSFNNVHTKVYVDTSLNNLRALIGGGGGAQDPSINLIVIKNTAQDVSINNVYTKTYVDSSIYTKTYVDASFAGVYTKAYVDASFAGVYTKSYVDASFASVYTKSYVDASFASVYTKAYVDASFNGVYTKSYVDASFADVYTKTYVDASFNGVYTKSYVDSSINYILSNYSQGIKYQVNNNGFSAYSINNTTNATLTLVRGLTYIFSINASGHPFWIQTTSGAYNSGNVYNTGITNNGTQNSNLFWVIANDTPNVLYYVCEYHSSMQGTINIVDFDFAKMSDINSALTSYHTKTYVDASFADVYTKTYVDSSINSIILKNSAQDVSINGVYTKAYVDASFASVYTKAYVDSSFNSVYTKTYVDASFSDVYTKTYVDASLNSLNTKLYTLTNGAPEALDTLAEISTAIKGDASFGLVVYEKIASSDSSINDLRLLISTGSSTQDPSINLIVIKNTAQDVSINNVYTKTYIDASFNSVYNKSYFDSSINSIITKNSAQDVSINGFYTSSYIDNSFNAIRTTDFSLNNRLFVGGDASLNSKLYVVGDASLNSRLFVGGDASFNTKFRVGGDASFNANMQLGASVSINKAINASFALDVSGAANIVGNLSVTKRPSDTNYSYFDLSNVNLNIFNTIEKFTTLTFNATTMTMDYSQGSIFYTTATANFAALLITNVPTTLNRSITVTLIASQSGTFYFTGTAVSVNGSSINYIKQDGTAFAAPAASRTAVIYQFNIIYASATPTVIAFMTGYA